MTNYNEKRFAELKGAMEAINGIHPYITPKHEVEAQSMADLKAKHKAEVAEFKSQGQINMGFNKMLHDEYEREMNDFNIGDSSIRPRKPDYIRKPDGSVYGGF